MNQLPATSAFNPPDGPGFPAAILRDNEPMFRRAGRHSRRVRILRIAIPVVAVVGLLVLTLATWFSPLRLLARLPVDFGSLVISGTKITMAQPKLSGYTRDARWYELTAHSAAQDITRPDIVELKEIRAKIETEDKATINLSAADGVYDRKAGILKLGREIVLQSSNGTEVRLSEAVIDTGSGDMVSAQPVEVKFLQGTLNANRLEVVKAGEVVRFENGVRLDLPAGVAMPPAAPKADKP
jgi:lipopolysaccharide export system protein LptC